MIERELKERNKRKIAVRLLFVVVTNSEILPKFSLSCEPHLLRCACAITAY
jgi:hypothetical protein